MKGYLKRLLIILTVINLMQPAAIVTAEEKKEELVTGITLTETELTVNKGKTVTIRATVEPAKIKNKPEWSSTDETVATVRNGQVKGVGNGTCRIICKATDGSGVEASCSVTVTTPVRTIKIVQGTKMEVPVDTTVQLEAVITPEDASIKELRWESAKPDIVEIDEEGKVTGKKKGASKITAYTTDGTNRKASILIKVDKYDVVFFDSKSKTVEYEYGSGIYVVKASARNKRVKITGIDKEGRMVLIGNDRWKDKCTVTPLKPGTDMIVIKAGTVTNYIRVYIAPDAFKEK